MQDMKVGNLEKIRNRQTDSVVNRNDVNWQTFSVQYGKVLKSYNDISVDGNDNLVIGPKFAKPLSLTHHQIPHAFDMYTIWPVLQIGKQYSSSITTQVYPAVWQLEDSTAL